MASRTDGKGAVTTFDYNDRGELITTHSPDPRGVERYTYDELSRQVTVTDGNGTTIGYEYDWLDRLVQSPTSPAATATSGRPPPTTATATPPPPTAPPRGSTTPTPRAGRSPHRAPPPATCSRSWGTATTRPATSPGSSSPAPPPATPTTPPTGASP
ncbi:hypothetical protein ACFQRI_20785 [Saccharopolyspora griseoalba]|uniref:RHS repeat protein n=1 Tax=Saccharopolyspora griseoalba TaxID=1431848 RepID=A0ABW2LRJ4_9PSEU